MIRAFFVSCVALLGLTCEFSPTGLSAASDRDDYPAFVSDWGPLWQGPQRLCDRLDEGIHLCTRTNRRRDVKRLKKRFHVVKAC